ncbi:endonuclease/exonuclease/phosphatase family protein [Chitinophaga qingshengii]|uniref:Endonuclease/exonuclease/phosphatase family protein n=1 Tax=Chitinophaga qingshengii TaxID=1569794 RepID=A0ABR7TSX7_9BACT|nr:endonuclease/exonuclease/phosphatase family protein [Chitinophaga qingshengii]MBC9933574.1 endonuclease/exonuclease/phosphatase family protein [Chitinophaga qingshengii]
MKFVCSLLFIAILTTAFLPLLNPGTWWISGFAALAFPLVFLLGLLSLPLWWWLKKKYALYTGIALLLCIPPALKTWGLHFSPRTNITKETGSRDFTLMTYNTSSMGVQAYKLNAGLRSSIFRQITDTQPDILCLQEFYNNDAPQLSHNIDSLQQVGHYPYHYFTRDQVLWTTWHYGIAVFSRYPIVAATTILSDSLAKGSGRSFLQADVLIQQDTVRIFSVQFTSYMLSREELRISQLRSLTRKMKTTFSRRASQAKQLAALVAASPYPVIVTGDFNDTPASWCYRTAAAGLQDAFLATGLGWGRTLSFLSPTLRIDYILAGNRFNIEGYRTIKMPQSEHFPVISRLSLKKH